MKDFKEILLEAKLKLLEMHYKTKTGHIGGNMSCIDVLMALYHLVMLEDDRFILSKGHSAGALYATLWSLGKLSDSDLDTFSQDDTFLPGHPSGQGIPGLRFSTGSLGHGPSLAAGLAIAAKITKNDRHIYCLCSDGEWQEGSCWEAIIFANHHRLSNLTIIIDKNNFQGFGSTQDVASFNCMAEKFISFGVNVIEAEGNNYERVLEAFDSRKENNTNVIILNTVKGNGLHFEDTLESHYLPLNESQYRYAIKKLKGEL
jgi:transketolase